VSHVAISSPNPQNLNSEPPPLVFWSVTQINAGKAASVYASNLQHTVQCLDTGSGNTAPEWVWHVVPEDPTSPNTYTIDAIATSPWLLTDASTYTMSVAAVVRSSTTFSLDITSPSIPASDFTMSTVTLSPATSATSLALSALNGATVVSLSHLQQSPSGSTFLLTYNAPNSLSNPCGGLFVRAGGVVSNVQICSGLAPVVRAGGLLSSATSSASSITAMVFLVFADAPSTVYQSYVISAGGGLSLTAPTAWAFHATSGRINSIATLWPGILSLLCS